MQPTHRAWFIMMLGALGVTFQLDRARAQSDVDTIVPRHGLFLGNLPPVGGIQDYDPVAALFVGGTLSLSNRFP